MIRETHDTELWTKLLNAEWQREQEALGNKSGLTFAGFRDEPDKHYIIDDADPTVVMHFVASEIPGEVYVPWLLGESKRIDSGELFSWATDYLISKGYTTAEFAPTGQGTNADKAKEQTKAVSVGSKTKVLLTQARTELDKVIVAKAAKIK